LPACFSAEAEWGQLCQYRSAATATPEPAESLDVVQGGQELGSDT
jgi:hypothetical protein